MTLDLSWDVDMNLDVTLDMDVDMKFKALSLMFARRQRDEP